jgi:hypothetical protein
MSCNTLGHGHYQKWASQGFTLHELAYSGIIQLGITTKPKRGGELEKKEISNLTMMPLGITTKPKRGGET